MPYGPRLRVASLVIIIHQEAMNLDDVTQNISQRDIALLAPAGMSLILRSHFRSALHLYRSSPHICLLGQ